MKKKIIGLILLILMLFTSKTIQAKDMDSILILVDELTLERIEELSIEKYCIGLVNYKTRPPYYKENLLLSINTGRKLSLKEFRNKKAKIEYLGDVLKDHKVSFIGEKSENLLISNSKGEVDYKIDEVKYELDWIIDKTDLFLKKSNILSISYDFKDDPNRIEILKKYLEHYKSKNIIILPEKVSGEENSLFNRFIVPIIYINGTDTGILTSRSTNREGIIALEDISVQLKNIYEIDISKNIGKPFEIIYKDNPLEEIEGIFNNIMNLLILATIFHGLIYFIQVLFGIRLLIFKKVDSWVYKTCCILAASIPTSIILGQFNFHKNILLYLFISIILSYVIIEVINIKKLNLINILSKFTYGIIVVGTLFYPKIIYNSYIGFNNLVYGARYFGLNNGIMGVLLITSILLFFSSINGIKKERHKKILGLFIFTLNMIVLSARFGANTGGFITSILLFGLMVSFMFSLHRDNVKKFILFLVLGIGIFIINMIFDYNNISKSHAINFLYRIRENGVWELITMASFKAKELFKLIIMPPFSIVLVFQLLILIEMKKYIKENSYLKNKILVILITSVVGMLINDTGSITFIYMIFFLILDIINELSHTNIKFDNN